MPIITTIRGNVSPFGKRHIPIIGLGSTGGTITTAGGYRYHAFKTPGTFTFTPDNPGTVELLIVAGGGGGGYDVSGGGGAGGLVSQSLNLAAGNFTVTVGDGGLGSNNIAGSQSNATSGGNSSFTGATTAIGGGRGGNITSVGQPGGSGGGSGWNSTGGLGTAGQGYNGGNSDSSNYQASGGGGSGAAGGNGANFFGGNGGIGLDYSSFSAATNS